MKIRFAKGTHKGKEGWEDDSKQYAEDSGYRAVIVKTKNILKQTRVLFTSIRKPFEDATSREEAAIQQHPDLELAIIELAEKWAEIPDYDHNNVMSLLFEELQIADSHQEQRGFKARYRRVFFPSKKNKRDRNDEDEMHN